MTRASTLVLKEQVLSSSTTTTSRRAAHDFQRGCRTTFSKFSSKEAHLVLVQILTWQKEQTLHLPIVKVVRRIRNSIKSVARAARSLGSHEMLVFMALSTRSRRVSSWSTSRTPFHRAYQATACPRQTLMPPLSRLTASQGFCSSATSWQQVQ